MRTRAERRVAARYRWDRLTVSFWFVPALMALLAVLAAWAMYWLDMNIPNQALQNSRLILAGTVGELRTSLLTIATTVLATAGVVFTLLTLPLSTVAAQYGSRLLRLFLGDRTAQFVLGMFVATFVYCLAGALSIPPVDVNSESPQLTATVGLYLMLATFATLILLVQHVSTMLQAPNIAAAAGEELQQVISAANPEGGATDDGRTERLDAVWNAQGAPSAAMAVDGYPVRVAEAGYIQYIDPATLLALARDRNLLIRLQHKPGNFVAPGAVVAVVWPAERVSRQFDKLLRRAFQIGNVRTPTQDIVYAVNQLTEMAVRAMSPAINDPFTAMTCLDHIGNGLRLFIRQEAKGADYYDQDGKLRLVLEPVSFGELVSAAFDMLRHASCDNAYVLQHMLAVIDLIGQETNAPEARQLLLHQVDLILAESQASHLIADDRSCIEQSSATLILKLNGVFSSATPVREN